MQLLGNPRIRELLEAVWSSFRGGRGYEHHIAITLVSGKDNMEVIGCGARLKLYALTSLERDAISAIVRRMNLVVVYATQIKVQKVFYRTYTDGSPGMLLDKILHLVLLGPCLVMDYAGEHQL